MNPFSSIHEIASLPSHEFENACRHHTGYAYLGDHLAICKILTKYKVYIDTRDIGVSPHFIMDGFWETWLTQCLSRIVKPGDICIDAGANFGYYSLLMSELCGKQGKTISIEPHPHICQVLRFSQSVHPWKFDIIQAALSDKNGEAELAVPEHYAGGSSILPDHWFDAQAKIKVEVITLDEMIKKMNLARVDVIKMDVEGAEPMVFAGMKETIKNNPGLKIIIEYSPFFYKDAQKFSDYLFDNFIISRIKDVPEVQVLDAASMNKLLELTDHTDLLLVRK